MSCDSREGRSQTTHAANAGPLTKGDIGGLTWSCLAWRRHCISHERFKDWRVLKVRCENDGVFSEIKDECVATPTSHDLHGFKRNASEEVFKSSSDADAMSFQTVSGAQALSSLSQTLEEGGTSQRSYSRCVSPTKQSTIDRRCVDMEVIVEH
jgi:hypothetical protein